MESASNHLLKKQCPLSGIVSSFSQQLKSLWLEQREIEERTVIGGEETDTIMESQGRQGWKANVRTSAFPLSKTEITSGFWI